jgi:hypothetical protein
MSTILPFGVDDLGIDIERRSLETKNKIGIYCAMDNNKIPSFSTF